jgi:hypothetical protein
MGRMKKSQQGVQRHCSQSQFWNILEWEVRRVETVMVVGGLELKKPMKFTELTRALGI